MNLPVTNATVYRQYEKGFSRLLKTYGGRLVTYGDAAFAVDGEAPRSCCMILAEFPSGALARAWFADPEYRALSEHRRAGTRLEFVTMVRGMPPR